MWILGPLLREASSSAPLLFSQGPPSCLACLFGRMGAPPQLPMGPPPLLEGFLDRSGWGHPSRSGHQPDSVGILNQGCVTKSGPICSAWARWDCCAGLIPASLRGQKGPRDKERHKLKEHTGGVDLTAYLSAT